MLEFPKDKDKLDPDNLENGENPDFLGKEQEISDDPFPPEFYEGFYKDEDGIWRLIPDPPKGVGSFTFTPEQEELAEKILNGLSPEQLQGIKEKIRDVYKEGIAHTAIGDHNLSIHSKSLNERLSSVFRLGVINGNWLMKIFERRGESLGRTQQKLAKRVRGNVYFNIVGKSVLREHDGKWAHNRSEVGPFVYLEGNESSAAVIFDLGKYRSAREKDYLDYLKNPEEFENRRGWLMPSESDSYTYSGSRKQFVSNLKEKGIPLDENGLPKASSEYGYAIKNMIPASFFLGLVLYSQDGDYKEFLKKTLICMALNTTPEKFIPVYDFRGNILWPEQKTHEQIVQEFRDKER